MVTIVHGDLHSQNVLVDNDGNPWLIDFGWCRDDSSPIIDLVMLECSLKFVAFPRRSDLRPLVKLEQRLADEVAPAPKLGAVPYSEQLGNVYTAIRAVRRYAVEQLHIAFEHYRTALWLMTYCLSAHPELNRPYVLASLQILTATI